MKCEQKKKKFVLNEFKKGKLKTSYGKKVKNPLQAVAIAYSEAKKYCKKNQKKK
jgi:hypothetical protein